MTHKNKTTYSSNIDANLSIIRINYYCHSTSLNYRFTGGRNSFFVFLIISILLMLSSCSHSNPKISDEERHLADSLVRHVSNPDSLANLSSRLLSEGNKLGSIVALREYGKLLRNESRFDEALNIHSEGLRQAEALNDTIEWIQALNNIGTDYRRLGILDVAQNYHYKAWVLSRDCSDTSYTTKKNRVVSLNGLGNIYLTMGNYERADSVLCLALEGERELNSEVGQAINFANLGSIFEHQNQIDSAWIYYRKSMDMNLKANSRLGISLCHTYFGSLYEKSGKYKEALNEYKKAYDIMIESKDEWHAVNTLISLAGIYNSMGENEKMIQYLERALKVAEKIKSNEHLAEIYILYYEHYKRKYDYNKALKCYEKAITLQKSVVDAEKQNRILNTMLLIEQTQQQQKVNEVYVRLENNRKVQRVTHIAYALALILLCGGIGTLIYIIRLRNQSHQNLKRMSTLRETFFTNITHEFRTPLSVILGLSHDVEKDQTLPKEVTDKMNVIQRQGNGLLTLINQLLDISKIKYSVGDPDWYNGNIVAYIEMIIESYHDYARSRNINLQFIAKGIVEMDFIPDYLNKVISNLISNALKFTPEYGKITIHVWHDKDLFHIEVVDTGKGMDREVISHIFEPFYQGNDHGNVGSGIGLSLVKMIVDSVDGVISVESTNGMGTTFHISVPIHNKYKTHLPATALDINKPVLVKQEMTAPDDNVSDSDSRVLIVEDNPDVARYIGSQFSDIYSVYYAEDGEKALEKAMEIVPDIIITDIMMPGMNGFDFCRSIRSNELTSHIPIIIVSAKVSEKDRIEGLKAGADAYLIKPFNEGELIVRVEKLMEQRKLLRKKFCQDVVEGNEHSDSVTNEDRRFLTKTVNAIYLLMTERRVNIDVLADKMCLSPRQFHRKITALTGETPAIFVLRIRMKCAQQLIDSNPQWTMNQIADNCGFDSYSSFYQAFKKIYNISPKDYKRGLK